MAAPQKPTLWKEELPLEDRHKLIERLTTTLKECVPSAVADASQEKKFLEFATNFENSVYHSASSKEEYLHCIALRMYKLKKTPYPQNNNVSNLETSQAATIAPIPSLSSTHTSENISIDSNHVNNSTSNHADYNHSLNPLSTFQSPSPNSFNGATLNKTNGKPPVQNFKAPTPANNSATLTTNSLAFNHHVSTPQPFVSSPSPLTPSFQASTPSIAPVPHTPQGPLSGEERDKFWEQLYSMKRFIEPLGRMLSRIKTKGNHASATKLEFIYKLISETKDRSVVSKKVNLQTLLKCEEQLERYLGVSKSPATTPVNFNVATPNLSHAPGKEKDSSQALISNSLNASTSPTISIPSNEMKPPVSIMLTCSPVMPPSGSKKISYRILSEIVEKLTKSIFSNHVIREAFLSAVLLYDSLMHSLSYHLLDSSLIFPSSRRFHSTGTTSRRKSSDSFPPSYDSSSKRGVWFQKRLASDSNLMRPCKSIKTSLHDSPMLVKCSLAHPSNPWIHLLPAALRKELSNLSSGFRIKFDRKTLDRALKFSGDVAAGNDTWRQDCFRRLEHNMHTSGGRNRHFQQQQLGREGANFSQVDSNWEIIYSPFRNTNRIQYIDDNFISQALFKQSNRSQDARSKVFPDLKSTYFHGSLANDDLTLWVSLEKLFENNIPHIPELTIVIPRGYPNEAPRWRFDSCFFGPSSYVSLVLQHLESLLALLPVPYSLTQILDSFALAAFRSVKMSDSVKYLGGNDRNLISAPIRFR